MVEHTLHWISQLPHKHPQTYLFGTLRHQQPISRALQTFSVLIWTEQLDASIFCTVGFPTLQRLADRNANLRRFGQMQGRIFCQFPLFPKLHCDNVPNSDKVISYMKSQGFPNQVITVMIVLLLVFSIPCRSDAGRFSFSIYVHMVHHFMIISSEIFNFR